jgi:hypothetical protein
MKVKIGKYTSWFGPYQLAELLCFWVKKEKDEYGFEEKPDWVHKFGEWLAYGSVSPEPKVGGISRLNKDREKTRLYRFLLWVESKKKRTVKVHIDPWDTWSMDHTLAHIIHPMLIQLKKTQHGAPYVDDKDVPKHLRRVAAEPLTEEEKNCGVTDSLHFQRWEWVLDEMIFAFASELDDSWEDQFYKGEHDIAWKQLENGMSEMIRMDKDTFEFDEKGHKKYHERIQNGFRLFGKYYQNLWD